MAPYFRKFRHQNRDFAIAAALAALLTAGFGAWMALRVAGVDVSQAVDDVGEGVTALLAAAACAVAAWRHRGRLRLAWALLGASALVWLAGEAAWSYLELIHERQVPFPSAADRYGKLELVDTGWVAGYLLIALGAVRAALSAGPAAQADDRPFGRWTLLLPYIPVTIAAVLAVLKNVGGAPDPFLLWVLIIVVGLVMLRQFIVIWDNYALNQKLESQSAALRDSEAHFRSLVQNSGDVVVLADAQAVVRFVSTSIDRFFAYTATELEGQAFSELLHPSDRAAFAAGLKKALTASAMPVGVDCRFRHKLGSWTHCEVTITNLLHRSSSQALVLNIRDVTDRKEMEERLAYLGAHDPVTNLPNRIAFRNQVDEALERSAPGRAIAVLALDIDDFKLLNDALGHRTGDDVLGMVGGRLGKIVSAGDVVARIGADEFGILMKTVLNDNQPVRLAERIFQHFRTPFKVLEREMVMRLSNGF